MRELLIATSNKGKLKEILAALQGVPFTVLTLDDVDKGPDVEEPGETFEGNAIIKAFVYGKRTGKLTLAEDSGLEIRALEGRPGVYSARYVPGTDTDRVKKILEEMKDVQEGEREAQFTCVAVAYDPSNDKLRIVKGVAKGTIATEMKGANGFGYDPIFVSDDLGVPNAELSMEQKNSISSRGKAMTKVREILLQEFV